MMSLAVGTGFEPAERNDVRRFLTTVQSTALPPHLGEPRILRSIYILSRSPNAFKA